MALKRKWFYLTITRSDDTEVYAKTKCTGKKLAVARGKIFGGIDSQVSLGSSYSRKYEAEPTITLK
jgi:hypothetical protein